MDQKTKKAILSLDKDDRCKKIDQVWPKFSDLVAERFNQIFESSDDHKEKCRARYEASHSRVSKNSPITKLLNWESEIFELALHEILLDLKNQLWKNGDWSQALEDSIRDMVLPSLKLHVAWGLSRSIRPFIEIPSKQIPGIGNPLVLNNDIIFPGWYQLAHLERELLFEDKALGEYKGSTNCFSAIMPNITDVQNAQEIGIFRSGNAEESWTCKNKYTENILPFIDGPIIGIQFLKDFLGCIDILMLSPQLLKFIEMKTPRWPSRLVLLDQDGKIGIVFRQWYLDPIGKHFNEEAKKLSGCDLIARPDIFEKIQTLSLNNVRVVKQVYEHLT